MSAIYRKTLNVGGYTIQIWKDPSDDFNIHATIKKGGYQDITTKEAAMLIGNLIKWHRLVASIQILKGLLNPK